MNSDIFQSAKAQGFSVSLYSIRKSARVLDAFTQFYLPFHNCELRVLFRHYDVFGCLSAAIYEIDEKIEAGIPAEVAFDQLNALLGYIEPKISVDDYIRERFADAKRYYQFETDLLRGSAEYSFADLQKLTEIRSFDFRIMHRALVAILGDKCDKQFLWFRSFEMLMELEDDLLSVQEDTIRGSYNIYCLATRLSPSSAPASVEEFRCGIERQLEECCRSFGTIEQAKCEAALTAYRRIVPRPAIPSINENVTTRQ